MAGLPNIQGTFGLSGSWAILENPTDIVYAGTPPSGAFSNIDQEAHFTGTHTSYSTETGAISFNASNSNNIYGSSDTITPLSCSCKFYIKH